MSLSNSNFDWVTARHECSLRIEFAKLKRNLERNTKTRQELAPKDRPADVAYKEDGDTCTVLRGPLPGAIGRTWDVTFILKDDHIAVTGNMVAKPLTLNLTFNDDGECRFTINGEGEYKRWQVLRRCLEPIFFGPTPPAF